MCEFFTSDVEHHPVEQIFEKLRPLDKDMYKMQKTLSIGAGGTIFVDEMSSASRSGPAPPTDAELLILCNALRKTCKRQYTARCGAANLVQYTPENQ